MSLLLLSVDHAVFCIVLEGVRSSCAWDSLKLSFVVNFSLKFVFCLEEEPAIPANLECIVQQLVVGIVE